MKAIAIILLAILILVFLYMAGRMFAAGCLRSWIEMMKKQQEGDESHGTEK